LKWAALLALPIGTAALLGISNFDKIKSLSVAYSGMLFSTSSPDVVKSAPSTISTFKPKQQVIKTSPTLTESAKQEPAVVKTIQVKPFAIIVGAFKFLENAEGLVSDLKSKGYDAAILGQTKTGLYRVSLNTFNDKNEAFEQLALVRSKEFSSAWLLVK
jgi:cell division septation protein DedD